MRQQQTKNIPLGAVLAQVLRDPNILWVSIGLKLISNIDDVIVYNTTGVHAAEVRGVMFIRRYTGPANQSKSIVYF